jgi:hypothetical protein
MGLKTGYYSMDDLKAFFISGFKVGDFIETTLRNGAECLRLRYKILSLERNGAECLLVAEEWNNGKLTNYNFEARRFLHQHYFKFFKRVL